MVTILKQANSIAQSALSKSPNAANALRRYNLWRSRWKQRRQLARLSDVMLKDIGISRSDADAEISKPFWKE